MTAARPSAHCLTLLAVLAAASASAGAISAPVAPDPVPQTAQPFGSQQDLKAASFDGGAFFVWNDSRTGGLWPDVRGIRIAFDGQKIDSDAVLIAGGPLAQDFADVACTPELCLVVWKNHESVEAARFRSNGQRLDTPALVLRTAPNLAAISVGTNGTDFLVAWARGAELELQPLAADGTLSSPMASLTRADDIRLSAVASDGNGWEIAWSEYTPPSSDQTRCTKFTPPSTFSAGPQILTTSSYPTFPDVAAGGPDGGYMVVWHSYLPGMFEGNVLSKQLGSDGIQIGGTLTLNSNTTTGFPSIAFDGERWLEVHRGPNTTLELIAIDADGGGGRTGPVGLSSGTADLPALATSGPNTGLIAWTENYGTEFGGKLRHARLSNFSLIPPGGTATLTAGNNQTNPAIAYGEGVFLVVWEDDRTGEHQLWASLLSDSGQVVRPAFALASEAGVNQTTPAVAFDGDGFVVAWAATRATESIRAVRVTTAGTVLGPPAVLSAVATSVLSRPTIAVGPAESYVLWDTSSSFCCNDLKVMRIFRDGGVGDPVDQSLMTTQNDSETEPAATFGPSGLCVAYRASGPPMTLRATCFDPATLEPRVDGGVEIAPTPTGSVGWLAIATTPSQTWAIHGNAFPTDALTAVEVLADGGAGPFVPVLSATETPFNYRAFQAQPSAAFDGVALAIVHEQVTADGGSDVVMRRLRADGGLLELVTIAGGSEEERFPVVTAATPGRVGIAYSAFDEASRRMKVFFRIWSDVAPGGFCTADAECANGLVCAGSSCSADAGVIGADGGSAADGGDATIDGGGGGNAGGARDRGTLAVGCGCNGTTSSILAPGLVALVFAFAARRRSGARSG